MENNYGTSSGSGSISDALKGSVPNKYLQYLQGHEQDAVWVIRAFFLLIVGGLLWYNIDAINHFMDGIISGIMKVAVIALASGVGWLAWKVLGNKTFRDGINHMIDRAIYGFVKRMKAHGDQFLEAEYDISLVEKYKLRLNQAVSRVLGSLKTIADSVKEAYSKATEAGNFAKGLQAEVERRRAGKQTPAVSRKVAEMTDRQLLDALESAKSTLRRNYKFFQNESLRRDRLSKRVGMLQEIARITGARIQDMKESLALAKQEYMNALAEMDATEAARDVEDSQAARDFKAAIERIKQETNLFAGRVQMAMNELDPTVQAYRTEEAGGSIDADEFFRAWVQDTNAQVDPNVESQILAPVEAPVIEDYDQLLGNQKTVRPATRPASRISSRTAPPSNDIDELLR